MGIGKAGIAIVGLGWGEKKCRVVAENPDSRLLCVVDRDEERARRIGAEYGVPWHLDLGEALATPGLDAVGIYTPSGTHGGQIEGAISAGKHVFCTKPLEITSARIDAIEKRARNAGLIVAVDHDRRYRPVVAQIKSLIDQGEMGRLVQGHFAFRAYRSREYYDAGGGWRGDPAVNGGGVLINQTIHLIDLALWLMGAPESVYARAATQCQDIEVEDTAAALLTFPGGATATIAGTTCFRTQPVPTDPAERARPQGSIDYVELCGSGGAVMLERGEPRRWNFTEPAIDPWTTMPADRPGDIVADVVKAIRTGISPTVDAAEARRSVALVEAMYESITTGAPVKL